MQQLRPLVQLLRKPLGRSAGRAQLPCLMQLRRAMVPYRQLR